MDKQIDEMLKAYKINLEQNLQQMEEIYDKYNTMQTKYKLNYNFDMDDSSIAKYINENITENTDKSSMIDMFNKIMPQSRIYKELLTYEFLFYEPIKQTNIDNLILATQSSLARYQYVVGGYNIEDITWRHTTESTRFTIKSNQRVLLNTIARRHVYNIEFIWFLKAFIQHVEKYNGCDGWNVRYKLIDDEVNEICWILIIFENV